MSNFTIWIESEGVVHKLVYDTDEEVWKDPIYLSIPRIRRAMRLNDALVFAGMMIIMLDFLGAPSEWKSKMSMGIVMAHVVYVIVFLLLD